MAVWSRLNSFPEAWVVEVEVIFSRTPLVKVEEAKESPDEVPVPVVTPEVNWTEPVPLGARVMFEFEAVVERARVPTACRFKLPVVAVERVKLPEVLVQAEVPPEARVKAPVELPKVVVEPAPVE